MLENEDLTLTIIPFEKAIAFFRKTLNDTCKQIQLNLRGIAHL